MWFYCIPIVFTTRVLKRAKVMFSQAFVCPTQGGRWATSKVNHPSGTRSQHLPPPGLRSQHHPPSLPSPLGPGHNTSLPPPPGTRSQHLPPPWDQVTTPPSPGTRSQHLPPRTRSQHLPLPRPGHNTSLPPPPWDQVTTPTFPPGLCAGRRYASYWNAFLLSFFWGGGEGYHYLWDICHSKSNFMRIEFKRKLVSWLFDGDVCFLSGAKNFASGVGKHGNFEADFTLEKYSKL